MSRRPAIAATTSRAAFVAALVTFAPLVACGTDAPRDSVPTTMPVPATLVYTVTFTVHAGPSCPVERPDQPCPDVPVRGTVIVRTPGAPDAQLVASGATDANGTYRVELLEGSYVVSVDTGAPLPRCEPIMVDVVDRNVEVDIACDSGIR